MGNIHMKAERSDRLVRGPDKPKALSASRTGVVRRKIRGKGGMV
jgi:hypothetical protein